MTVKVNPEKEGVIDSASSSTVTTPSASIYQNPIQFSLEMWIPYDVEEVESQYEGAV